MARLRLPRPLQRPRARRRARTSPAKRRPFGRRPSGARRQSERRIASAGAMRPAARGEGAGAAAPTRGPGGLALPPEPDAADAAPARASGRSTLRSPGGWCEVGRPGRTERARSRPERLWRGQPAPQASTWASQSHAAARDRGLDRRVGAPGWARSVARAPARAPMTARRARRRRARTERQLLASTSGPSGSSRRRRLSWCPLVPQVESPSRERARATTTSSARFGAGSSAVSAGGGTRTRTPAKGTRF
jgi:hypothetical protein